MSVKPAVETLKVQVTTKEATLEVPPTDLVSRILGAVGSRTKVDVDLVFDGLEFSSMHAFNWMGVRELDYGNLPAKPIEILLGALRKSGYEIAYYYTSRTSYIRLEISKQAYLTIP